MGKHIWKIGLAIGIIGGVGGLIAGIIAEPIGGSIAAAIFFGVMAFVWFKFLRPMAQNQRIRKSGERADGKILRIWDTGVTVNDNPQIGMEIEVIEEGMDPWTAEATAIISRLEPHKFQPGVMVAVNYDPEDHSKIAVLGLAGEVAPQGSREELEKMLYEVQAFNQELDKRGEEAPAIILEFIPMGINVNGNNPAATLKVKVLPKGDDPFDSEVKAVFGQEGLHKYQPGKEVIVKYDKWAKEQVTISFEFSKVSKGQP